MKDYTIREATIEDLIDAAALIWEVFIEFEGTDYSEEGLTFFKSGLKYETMKDRLLKDGQKMWLCCDGDRIIGVIRARQPCHINLLFVKKEYHRKGIARALFGVMKEHYKQAGSYSEVTVNSSRYAVEAYRRLGFVETDTEQMSDGIRYTPMEYII
ncbi:MAG: GNAT family N-acetyltransferase [Oscillospiraceae bacterium]|nr:GNAT family N-acetyltransferase [Oscillospiraceae bacterium]